MSALGQKRTLVGVCIMSALPPKADIELSREMSALCQKRTFAREAWRLPLRSASLAAPC